MLASCLLFWLPVQAPAQEIFKEITNQRLEDLLKSMDISYKKGDAGKGVFYYDFRRQGDDTLRLWSYSGKDLMLDAVLPKVEWEVVNKWNSVAKFSRAHLEKNEKSETTVLESNLDMAAGITVDNIKHFIGRFEEELARWNNKQTVTGTGEDDVFTNVAADRLEKVLKNLKIEFRKNQNNTAVNYYFQRNGYNLRIVNFGGSDLMVSCNFGQAPLAKINDWNIKRSLVRAVQYEENGKPYTALESNLDCVGGASEGIIRSFIEAFDEEVRAFDAYLK
jgi:hypothetical protein